MHRRKQAHIEHENNQEVPINARPHLRGLHGAMLVKPIDQVAGAQTLAGARYLASLHNVKHAHV